MKQPVIVPSAGESINEVFIGTWLKKTGDFVKKDETLVDLETQKASFELQAEASGKIEILFPDRDSCVKPGDTIAYIETSATDTIPEVKTATAVSKESAFKTEKTGEGLFSPAARKIAAEKNLDSLDLTGTGKGGRILKEDVLFVPAKVTEISSSRVGKNIPETAKPSLVQPTSESFTIDTNRGERLEPATRLRRQIAQNLVMAQHTAAILTTFNEVDMSEVIAFRKANKDRFKAKGLSLGIVSFFAFAALRALKEIPRVNSSFTGDGIIVRDFVDLSIAVSTDAGLVVPVIRDLDQMNLVQFETKLAELSEKAKAKKLSIPEMTGGSFTISNGGVFGSLLSTPILNPPQSAILGLHKTQDRPVVIDGQIVVRPMMYLALSYDHRLIDGKEAVQFLVKIKESIEDLSLIEHSLNAL